MCSTDVEVLIGFKEFYSTQADGMYISIQTVDALFETWVGSDPCLEQWAGVQCQPAAEDTTVLRVTALSVPAMSESFLQVSSILACVIQRLRWSWDVLAACTETRHNRGANMSWWDGGSDMTCTTHTWSYRVTCFQVSDA